MSHTIEQGQFCPNPFTWLACGASVLRNPRAHRGQHVWPKAIRAAMKKLIQHWKEHPQQEWRDAIQELHWRPLPWPAENQLVYSRSLFMNWLEERLFGNARIIEDVCNNLEQLQDTHILPGIKWCDFQGNEGPSLPSAVDAETWDLFLTDFRMDTFDMFRRILHDKYQLIDASTGTIPSGMFLRYHGTNMYGFSGFLACNYIPTSEPNVAGAEACLGRGVYTSRLFGKAMQYASRRWRRTRKGRTWRPRRATRARRP